jgi:ribose 5-phosphate isomerase B
MQFSRLGIACDHAGKDLKVMILDFVALMDLNVRDYGVGIDTEKSVDYPDYAKLLAEDVSKGNLDGAIAICGTGLGMAIAANKFPGVNATPVWDEYSCRMARMHNDSNILCLGARTLNFHRATDLVKIWLETSFAGDRHRFRVSKIRALEKSLLSRS